MRVPLIKVIMILTGLLSQLAMAQSTMTGEELVQVKRCYACHHLTEALIGPPYMAISARHNANGETKEMLSQALARKIVFGGGGSWGVVPMVPNEHVSNDEAVEISRWILGLADSE